MNKFLYSLFAFFIGIVGFSSCSDDNGETPEQYYTVEFNSMGGSEVKSQEVKAGELVVKPASPTKTGEVFVAWYASDKFDREWNFAEDVVKSDITLYAKWVAPEELCVVTFESNGGSKCESASLEKGGKLTSLPEPEKEGFTFDGWYKDAAFTTKFDLAETINGNMTLYAKWTPKSDDTVKKQLEELIAQAETVSKDGYTEDSYNFMQQALTSAKNVIANDKATAEELTKAYDALKEAFDGLMPAETSIIGKPYLIEFSEDLLDGKYCVINKNQQGKNLELFFYVVDACYEQCEGVDGEVEIESSGLENLAAGDVSLSRGSLSRGSLYFTLKSELTVGAEATVTIKSKTNPSVSLTITLKVYEDSYIKSEFVKRVEDCDISKVNLDNYFEYEKKYYSICALWWAISEEDRNGQELADANTKFTAFEEEFDYWWADPFVNIKDDVYALAADVVRYTPSASGAFPCGTYLTEWYEAGENNWSQDKYELGLDGKWVFSDRYMLDNENLTEWQWYDIGEYKYVKDGDKEFVIFHILEESWGEQASAMMVKRKMHKMSRR